MAKLVGTAGHVDHGKTSLIRALTGIDTDRLPEEKARGLTIDLGFAALDLEGVGRVSIVDVPGHEKFVTNMLAGATAMDVALLCVAADEGVLPQTQEHLAILDLLPVEEIVLVLTRCDVATAQQREDAAMELEFLLEGSRFEGAPLVETSAKTGAGLEDLKVILKDVLGDGQGRRGSGGWWLAVDRVFTKTGHGTVVTGTLIGGSAKQGQDAVIWPGRRKAKVRGMQSHGVGLGEAEPGTRVSMNLGGVDRDEVERGDLVCLAGTGAETVCFDAEVRWAGDAPKHGSRVRVAMGTSEGIGRVFLNDYDEGLVQVRLERALGVVTGMPLVLRRYSPPSVLGGGSVLVATAEVRRKNVRAGLSRSGGGSGSGILGLFDGRTDGLSTAEIARRMGMEERGLAEEFERLKGSGELLGFAGYWMTPDVEGVCRERMREALEQLHVRFAERSLLPREEAVREAGAGWAGKVLDRLITYWVEAGFLRSRGTLVALTTHQPELKGKQRALLDRVSAVLSERFPNVPGGRELADLLGVPPQAVDQILQVGIDAGELVWLAEGIVYVLADFEGLVKGLRETYVGRTFSASEFRDDFGTSRKYAIPLLEYLDGRGVTVRMGDVRKVV